MSTFTPTAEQTNIFSISWASCMASISQMTTSELQTELNNLAPHIGNWNVVWGPSYILAGKDSTAANTMFVAQQADSDGKGLPYYVVAIAATNQNSMFDIMVEDGDIVPMAWPYVNGTSAQVTTGDNTGLTNLLGMKSPDGTGVTLQTFLSDIPNQSGTTLWFTGHSLGGALSPMLTLALMDPSSTLNSTGPNVNVNHWGKVGLLATAGPSIGDSSFLSYFQSTLVNTPKNTEIEFIWNGLDVVPHAWNNASLLQITNPNIYGINLKPGGCVATAIGNAQENALNYSYVMFNQTPAFTADKESYSFPAAAWNSESEFVAQMDFQHINAYVNAFACSGWFSPKDLCKDPTKAEEAVLAICSALSNKAAAVIATADSGANMP